MIYKIEGDILKYHQMYKCGVFTLDHVETNVSNNRIERYKKLFRLMDGNRDQ